MPVTPFSSAPASGAATSRQRPSGAREAGSPDVMPPCASTPVPL
ncbi:hypothetical protein [Rubricoccus marinus]|nr:hypothetical protein [Rubricoccus marinus]